MEMTSRTARISVGLGITLLLAGLAGCTSADPTAGLSPQAEIGGGSGGMPAMTGSIRAYAPEAAPAPVASTGPVQFLPVVGAPADQVEVLSEALGREAARAGVALAPAEGPVASLRLKGYLSALGDGRGTVVIYVWDVIDQAGNRISRIQGQERVAGSAPGADVWAGVGPQTLGAIAAKTIGELSRRASAG